MLNSNVSVQIKEVYKDYTPPISAKSVAQRLVDHVPEKYLGGLEQIILTNASGLPRQRRRHKIKSRKRKVHISEALGVYHKKTNSSPAQIEIFIDNIPELQIKFIQRFPVFRDASIGKVLYHELGHHIHATYHPEHQEPEEVAEKWKQELMGQYVKKQYWYWLPIQRQLDRLRASKWYKQWLNSLIRKQKELG